MMLLVAGMFYGLLMLAAGVAVGEALSERRHQIAEQCIHDEWDAACRICATGDMPRTRQSGTDV